MKKILSIICCALFIYACEKTVSEDSSHTVTDNNSSGGVTSIDKKYWGRWLWLDNPSKEEILDKNTKSDACMVYDNDLLECKLVSFTNKKYLVREGASYLKVRGAVSKLGTSARYSRELKVGGADFGSLNAALSISRTDKDGNKTEYGKTATKDDGSFEFSDIPSGDYEVRIENSELSGSANVSLNNSNADAGVITAVSENSRNFKSELIFDNTFLFADYTVYNGKIRITNTGKMDAESLSYSFSYDDPSIETNLYSDETQNSVGTLLAGKSRDIAFKVAFKYIDVPKKTVRINITVRDLYGQEWHDYVSFEIFRRYSLLNLKSEKTLNGFLDIPGQKILAIHGTDITTKIPYIHNEAYHLTLVNADIRNETKYSFGIDSKPLDYSDVEPSAHEPNDTKEVAVAVEHMTSVKSYMARSGSGARKGEPGNGDIDRFKIVMNSPDAVQEAVRINFYEYAFCDKVDHTSWMFDLEGNGNGVLNSGESVFFVVAVKNAGNSTAYAVSIATELSDPYVTLTMPKTLPSYDILGGEVLDHYGYIKGRSGYLGYSDACSTSNASQLRWLKIDNNTPANYKTNIKVVATDKYGNKWEDYIPIVVNPVQDSGTASAGLMAKKLLSAGGLSYAETEDGKHYLWGNIGELTDAGRYTPTPTEVSFTVKDVVTAPGNSTYYALTETGLYAWGKNDYGQVGNGNTTDVATPSRVQISDNVKSIITNNLTVYAVTNTGLLYAWGYNYYGQVGDGSTTRATTPKKIDISGNVKNVITTAGDHTTVYAITDTGALYAWGSNYYGQVGSGNTTDDVVASPQKINVSGNVKTVITAGSSYYTTVYALTDTGALYAWGSNYHGQVGNGESSYYNGVTIPTKVQISDNVKEIVTAGSGYYATYAITDTGSLYAWGNNYYDQVGNGSGSYIETPVKITLSGNVKKIIPSGYTIYAVTDTGSLYAWGDNGYGQVGNGTTSNVTKPVEITLSGSVKEIIPSGYTVYAVTDTGLFYAWGKNDSGQVGSGITGNATTPKKIEISGSVKKLVLVNSTIYAITNEGSLYVWGDNNNNQAGSGTAGFINKPTKVELSGNVQDVIHAGSAYGMTVYVITDSGVYAWGNNYYGQVGNGTAYVDITTPAKI